MLWYGCSATVQAGLFVRCWCQQFLCQGKGASEWLSLTDLSLEYKATFIQVSRAYALNECEFLKGFSTVSGGVGG